MAPRSRNTLWIVVSLILVNLGIWYNYNHYSPRLQSPIPNGELDSEAPSVIQQDSVAAPAPPLVKGLEAIEVTLMLLGADTAREGATAIKSVLMHASRPVVLHLICSEDAIPVLEPHFALIRRPYYPVKVRYYPITTDMVRERAERAKLGRNWNVLSKLFIQEILHDVEKAIFIDTDMIFVVDPVQLWNTFSTFNETNVLAFPTLGRRSHAGRICTCVMLLHLARMRTSGQIWMPSTLLPELDSPTIPAFKQAAVDGVVDVVDPTQRIPWDPLEPWFADQGVYHVIWTYQPHLFKHLSLRWDITHCRLDYGLKLGLVNEDDDIDMSENDHIAQQFDSIESGDGLVIPGILHFNCLPDAGDNVWDHEDSYEKSTWGPMVTTAARYKWVWLNRGDGTANFTTEKVDDIRWLDERLEEARSGPRLPAGARE